MGGGDGHRFMPFLRAGVDNIPSCPVWETIYGSGYGSCVLIMVGAVVSFCV